MLLTRTHGTLLLIESGVVVVTEQALRSIEDALAIWYRGLRTTITIVGLDVRIQRNNRSMNTEHVSLTVTVYFTRHAGSSRPRANPGELGLAMSWSDHDFDGNATCLPEQTHIPAVFPEKNEAGETELKSTLTDLNVTTTNILGISTVFCAILTESGPTPSQLIHFVLYSK